MVHMHLHCSCDSSLHSISALRKHSHVRPWKKFHLVSGPPFHTSMERPSIKSQRTAWLRVEHPFSIQRTRMYVRIVPRSVAYVCIHFECDVTMLEKWGGGLCPPYFESEGALPPCSPPPPPPSRLRRHCVPLPE